MQNFEQTTINLSDEKTFLHDALNLTGAEISINCAPKGFKVPFNHSHIQNEEIYIFLFGKGVMTIDDIKTPIEAGSVVKIAPNAARTLENTGDTELKFICVQTKENSLTQFGLNDAKLC